eukprot:8040982-Lingulodinium_polyedra.AAC.1
MQEMPTSRPLVDGLMVVVTVHGVPADRAQIDGVVAATFVAHALISMSAFLCIGGPIPAAMRSRRLSWHDGNGGLAPRSEGGQPERPSDAGCLKDGVHDLRLQFFVCLGVASS